MEASDCSFLLFCRRLRRRFTQPRRRRSAPPSPTPHFNFSLRFLTWIVRGQGQMVAARDPDLEPPSAHPSPGLLLLFSWKRQGESWGFAERQDPFIHQMIAQAFVLFFMSRF